MVKFGNWHARNEVKTVCMGNWAWLSAEADCCWDTGTDTSRHMYCNSATQLLLCVHNRLQKTVVESAQNATFMKGLLKVNNCSRQLLVTVQVRNSHVADSCCWHTQYFQTAVVDCAQTQYTLSMLTAVVDSAQYLCCWQVMMTVHNIYVADCALGWSDLAFF